MKRALFHKLDTKSLYFPFMSSKSKDQKKLPAHFEEAHDTLVCRGTPVEKHCSRGSSNIDMAGRESKKVEKHCSKLIPNC